MGAYYFYVNETKREYFSIDPVLNSETKGSLVGNSIGSRAFAFLLWADDTAHSGTSNHSLLGSWIGDRVIVTSDDYGQNFDVIESQFNDIRQNVVELLIVTSPFQVLEYSGEWWIESLVNGQCDGVMFTDAMRKTLREEFSDQHKSYPNDFYARVLRAL